MKQWDLLQLTERELWQTTFVLFGVSVISALVSIWVKDMHWPAVVAALLASHSSTAAQAVGRIKAMQARIDMMRIARGEEPE